MYNDIYTIKIAIYLSSDLTTNRKYNCEYDVLYDKVLTHHVDDCNSGLDVSSVSSIRKLILHSIKDMI